MRGQSSFEAISLFATATIILSIFMIYFGSQISTQAEEREYLALRDVADTLRQEILIARQAGPGYTRRIEIPATSGSDSKRIIFDLEYSDDPNVSSELTVSFIPPIKDTIEASQILGPGVYGLFSGGTNTIKVYDGGIVVWPDPEAMDALLYAGTITLDELPDPEVAFAYIEGPSVRLSDQIECEYGISNEFVAYDATFGGNPGTGNKNVEVAWVVHDESGGETCVSGPIKDLGERFFLSDLSSTPSMFREGSNLSCAVRYFSSAGGGGMSSEVCAVITGSGFSDERITTSRNVTIVNSLPNIEVIGRDVSTETRGDGRSAWTIELEVEVFDVDTDDTAFNVSIVADGTNAAYMRCDNPNGDCLAQKRVEEGYIGRFVFVYDAPWPEGEGCQAIDDLSFRIKAIEADSTSELYTLEPVDISNELRCQEGADA